MNDWILLTELFEKYFPLPSHNLSKKPVRKHNNSSTQNGGEIGDRIVLKVWIDKLVFDEMIFSFDIFLQYRKLMQGVDMKAKLFRAFTEVSRIIPWVFCLWCGNSH